MFGMYILTVLAKYFLQLFKDLFIKLNKYFNSSFECLNALLEASIKMMREAE